MIGRLIILFDEVYTLFYDVDELPKTATGKIKRYKLRQMAQGKG